MLIQSEYNQTLSWLLEPDETLPSMRYLALRSLLDLAEDDSQVRAARAQLMANGPVPRILEHEAPEGYWFKPGPGYEDKYHSTAWQVILLAQLGVDGRDPRVHKAGEYVLEHSRAPNGCFSITATNSGTIHCLAGNLCAALLDLGFGGDPRLEQAVAWLARSITGEGIAPSEATRARVRYLRSGNCAPGFCCSANNREPCAWGAVKAVVALGKLPPAERMPGVQAAVERGTAFLLSRNPAAADYPMGYAAKPSGTWFKLGMPISYMADVLQVLEALAALGYAGDPRLQQAFEWLLARQDAQDRWTMENSFNGKTWADIETKGQPSKWVTLRALRVLKQRP
ncbi:MAG: nitrogen fixation protein NifH [Anaerolineae bacterium]